LGAECMLGLAVFTRNEGTAHAIEQIVHETDLMRVVASVDPAASVHESMRTLGIHEPELVLADLADWDQLAAVREAARRAGRRARWIGFARSWSPREEIAFAQRGISSLLKIPFQANDLEQSAFRALHSGPPEVRPGLWAFLPAKAGGGCSTLVLNTAGALHQVSQREVLVIEADARSGSFAMLMDLQMPKPLDQALSLAAEMTPLEWRNYRAELGGVHILPADPSRPRRLPSWADYSQLLHFLEHRYREIFVDLPEVVNDATAEVVRRAEYVFVVCTPEIPSLKMTDIRCQDLLARGVPRDRIRLIVTRFTRSEVSTKDVERNLGWPVYATLANDYKAVRSSILEARLVASDCSFGKDCRMLAKTLLTPAGTSVQMGAMERLSRLITN